MSSGLTSYRNRAWASCVVQFFLLLILLGGLSVLRRDAEASVLGPLRSMLKIVARYARNPLAGTEISKDNRNEPNESTSSDSSRASDEDDNGFGTYETEQLITAVAKITDLLRKCWGKLTYVSSLAIFIYLANFQNSSRGCRC